MCPAQIATDKFARHTTGEYNRMRGIASFKSSNAVYLIQCKRCSHQHVGEMGQPFHCRINGH